MLQIEAVLLTGGASRRMGQDKAFLEVAGRPIAYRVATSLIRYGYPVTVLGREPLAGISFQHDKEEFAGPLAALSNYQPKRKKVFVVSCDLPIFEPEIVKLLAETLESNPTSEAVVPEIEGKLQPTCALYRSTAWRFMPELISEGKKSLMAWLDKLNTVRLGEKTIREAGIDPILIRGANTPEDLTNLIQREAGGP